MHPQVNVFVLGSVFLQLAQLLRLHDLPIFQRCAAGPTLQSLLTPPTPKSVCCGGRSTSAEGLLTTVHPKSATRRRAQAGGPLAVHPLLCGAPGVTYRPKP